ncbi:MAG TPA: hypothetical protein VG501_05710 [Rhizomicrobium sp.]|nr:hypothetical protein [Rhizomicrobium sp.]
MKRMSIALLTGLVVAGAMAGPAMAASVCLNTRDIKSSDPAPDGASITFKMNDGKVWRNDLKGRCPDLKFNGFAWTLHEDQVCENQNSFRVLRSGQVCVLGKFTQVTTPAPPG